MGGFGRESRGRRRLAGLTQEELEERRAARDMDGKGIGGAE